MKKILSFPFLVLLFIGSIIVILSLKFISKINKTDAGFEFLKLYLNKDDWIIECDPVDSLRGKNNNNNLNKDVF